MSDNLFHSSIFAVMASVAAAAAIGTLSPTDVVKPSQRAHTKLTTTAIAQANPAPAPLPVVELPMVTVTGHRLAPRPADDFAVAGIE